MLLRGAAKFLAVAAIAAVLGVVLGIVLSELSGDDNVASTPTDVPTTAAERTTATTPTQTTARTQTSTTRTQRTTPPRTQTTPPSTSANRPRIRVISAVLQPASTPRGRARQRARLTVRVRVTNRAAERLTSPAPMLLSGADLVGVDSNANDVAGPLLEPIAAGESATGELRFETAGEVTKRLTDVRRGRLRIANRTVAVRVTIGDPARSSGPG